LWIPKKNADSCFHHEFLKFFRQNSFLQAQLDYLKAVINYNIAQDALKVAKGKTL